MVEVLEIASMPYLISLYNYLLDSQIKEEGIYILSKAYKVYY